MGGRRVSTLWLRRAELEPGVVRDVVVRDGRVAAIEASPKIADAQVAIDLACGALLRGLHDHHIHLFALAAAWQSVECGPPAVENEDDLAGALRDASTDREGGWLRGVGYHESVAGPLGRKRLDALSPQGVPVRVQHRTGAMWILNSEAIERVVVGVDGLPSGVECDSAGRPTGRIYAEDAWLRERLGDSAFPDLAPVGRFLARCGVTGATDATPDKDAATLAAIEGAMRSGALPQRVVAMGGLEAQPAEDSQLERGAHKIMLRERALPEFDALVARIEAAHRQDRGAAFHCVTRAELVLAAGALRAAGIHPGDRIEHASIAPDDLVSLLCELGVAVVTQPGFVHERGDVYLRDVEAGDRPWLYRGRGFLEGGVGLGAGTDAPYGDADPWRAIRAAVDRRTREGASLGPKEALTPERALALFTSPLEAPGAAPGPIAVGDAADLCALDCSWTKQREDLVRDHIALTVREGELIYQREAG